MKLRNKTDLKTDQLQHFIREVAKREMVELKDAVFTVVYRRISCHGAYIGGYAYYGMPPRVTLKVPKDIHIDRVELAYVVAHELGHSQGLHHNQMRNAIYSRRYAAKHNLDWRQHYLYAEEIPLERELLKVAIPVPKDLVIQQKRDKCLKMVNKWGTKIKRSQNIYKKWKQKTAYYERQLEKAAITIPNNT